MKRKPRRRSPTEKLSFPKAKTPAVKSSVFNREPLKNLDVAHMQELAHNAIMWADHEGGTILNKQSNPFFSELSMENIEETKAGKMSTGFTVRASANSNGSMMVLFWQDDDLVFCATDSPTGFYRYPSEKIKVMTYQSGDWEKFLTKKGYKK